MLSADVSNDGQVTDKARSSTLPPKLTHYNCIRFISLKEVTC